VTRVGHNSMQNSNLCFDWRMTTDTNIYAGTVNNLDL
jgi:hypothetical protein